MSKTAEKAPEQKSASFEQIFSTLEQRVEGLSKRIRDLVAENARLKGSVAETAAERDRFEKQLQDARSTSEAQVKAAERLAKLEAEREEVRARVERLLHGLEQAETSPEA